MSSCLTDRYLPVPWRGACRLATVLLVTLLAVSGAASGQEPSASPMAQDGTGPVVNCYDSARRLIVRTPRHACTGAILSDAEADRLRRERIKAVRQALGRKQGEPAPGQSRTGSGVVISRDGDVLTAHHVTEGCAALYVRSADGEVVAAERRASEPAHDLALLRAAFRPQAVAQLSADAAARDGYRAAVVGYPSHGMAVIRPEFTAAVMHAPAALAGDAFVLQAPLHPGHSGSPVLDEGGHVVGLVIMKRDPSKDRGGDGPELGIAISLPPLRAFLERNQVAAVAAAAEAPLSESAVFARARAFVVRVECR